MHNLEYLCIFGFLTLSKLYLYMDKPNWYSLTLQESLLYALNHSCDTCQEAQILHTIEAEEELLKIEKINEPIEEQ